jgi:pantoate--beta-alanine ligase
MKRVKSIMKIVATNIELNQIISEYKKQGKRIGFVPTMGALHQGHLSLVRQAKIENDIAVVSVFVNPTQFGPKEDFSKYPRDIDRDARLLETFATDILFYPSVAEVYPQKNPVRSLKADVALTEVACGVARPGHFDGVVTVVARLFDLVKPQRAYFGLKDYQQFLVIKRMAAQEKYPIKIIGCPIVREPDGLAMSSRNMYLSSEQRQQALLLSRTLAKAKNYSGTVAELRIFLLNQLAQEPAFRLDYLEILDSETLRPMLQLQHSRTVVLLAGYIGSTRLIDNILL